MGGRWILFLAALLVLPQNAAAWSQIGGSEDRAGTALLPPGPLDVLNGFRFTEGDEYLEMWRDVGLAETPLGLFGMVVTSQAVQGNCTMIRVSPREGLVERGVTVDVCDNDRSVVAYDPTRELILLCGLSAAEAPVLWAIEARTGLVRWTVRPTRDLGVIAMGGTDARDIWLCSGAAVDSATATAIVPFYSRTAGPPLRNRVVNVDLDTGKVRWSTHVPTSVFLPEDPAGAVEQYYYRPYTATVTDAGIALGGILGLQLTNSGYRLGERQVVDPVAQDAFQWAVAWLDKDGEVKGGKLAEDNAQSLADRAQSNSNVFAGSVWAAAQGDEAVTALGDSLLLINPSLNQLIRSVSLNVEEDVSNNDWWPATKWWGQSILVPLRQSVSMYDASNLEKRWTWSDGDWRIADTFIAAPGDAYVLAARNLTAGKEEARVVRLDLATGELRQEIPLPVRPRFQSGNIRQVEQSVEGTRWNARLQPLEDGTVLVWDDLGNAVLLGAASTDRVPDVTLPDAYPGLADAVTIKFTTSSQEPVRKYLVHWGEGPVEEITPERHEASHRYSNPGTKTLRVTALYEDNTTGTRERLVYPGEDAPTQSSALVRAFTGEGRDTTWGIIGILMAAASGAYALLRRRRLHQKLGKELAELRQIRAMSKADLSKALEALADFTVRLEHDVAKGRIEKGPHDVVVGKITSLRSDLHGMLVDHFAPRVTPRYKRLLETALADGIMNDAETKALLNGLKQEGGLSTKERGDLAKLIQNLA